MSKYRVSEKFTNFNDVLENTMEDDLDYSKYGDWIHSDFDTPPKVGGKSKNFRGRKTLEHMRLASVPNSSCGGGKIAI